MSDQETIAALAREILALREMLRKAHALYEAANYSLKNTDEDPEAERGQEIAQVYTMRGGWARLCDAIDEIDVDGPGFHLPAPHPHAQIAEKERRVVEAAKDLFDAETIHQIEAGSTGYVVRCAKLAKIRNLISDLEALKEANK